MTKAENKIFDEIKIGDTASLTRPLTHQDIQLFAMATGDMNPVHLDQATARKEHYQDIIGHSMWIGTIFSTLMGMQLPGPGTRLVSQTAQFVTPVKVGDSITAHVKAVSKDETSKRITFALLATNQSSEEVMKGEAVVIAPTFKQTWEYSLPNSICFTNNGYHGFSTVLLEKVKGLKPIITAVVHPVDSLSLLGAVTAHRDGVITAILVGPEAKIRAAAKETNTSLEGIEIVATAHSHAAAEKAVEMARLGQVEALMKGKLATEELLQAVVHKEKGIRTARRMSHVFVLDVPSYPKPLLLTDAAVNIQPTLFEKKDIVQNAVDLFHAIGLGTPYVAILSAVETVNEKMPSTLDAAALCKMSDRGQITGAILDGPLAFDNAVSAEASSIKGIHSPVAGNADILVVPDIESGNMLYKQLRYFSGANGAGIVLGAKVPIILTSRAGDAQNRAASSALAQLYIRSKG
jgi:phosphotransacetylase/acyl dehydratase